MIVSEISSHVHKCSHKYGIEIPTLIAHAKGLDKNNGNYYWTESTITEITNIGISFALLEEGQKDSTRLDQSKQAHRL